MMAVLNDQLEKFLKVNYGLLWDDASVKCLKPVYLCCRRRSPTSPTKGFPSPSLIPSPSLVSRSSQAEWAANDCLPFPQRDHVLSRGSSCLEGTWAWARLPSTLCPCWAACPLSWLPPCASASGYNWDRSLSVRTRSGGCLGIRAAQLGPR